jgi:hypothetical protein
MWDEEMFFVLFFTNKIILYLSISIALSASVSLMIPLNSNVYL